MHLKVCGIKNVKKVPKDYAVIFASNHASVIDPIFIPASLPFLSRFIPTYNIIRAEGKKSYKNKWINFLLVNFQFIFKFWGAYPSPFLIRVTEDSYKNALNVHLQILTNKKSLIIFPTGTIKTRKTCERPGTGISFLAQNSQCKIIPVQIIGIEKEEYFSLKKFFSRKYQICVKFGEMFEFKDIISDKIIDENNRTEIYLTVANIIVDKIAELGGSE